MIKTFYKPTPVFWRKIGDSLLAVSTFVVGFGMFTDNRTVALVALCVGVVGKFLTNFFTDGPSAKS